LRHQVLRLHPEAVRGPQLPSIDRARRAGENSRDRHAPMVHPLARMSPPERATRTLVATTIITFLVTFDGAAVQMALPRVRHELGATIGAAQFTMTAFVLATTAAYLPCGRLADSRGQSRVWRIGLGVFIAGSTACAVAQGLAWLVAARAVQAIGAAALTATSSP